MEQKTQIYNKSGNLIGTDNFGEKTTFYYKTISNNSDNLVTLIEKNGFEGFDPKGITSFFTFRYPIGNLTMFKGYKRIPFGSSWDRKRIVKNWYPSFEEEKIPFEEAKDNAEKLLVESIKDITEGKKIAIPLSGGIDSSLIVAICRKLYPDKNIYTYTAGFYGDDEFEYSRIIAKRFNTIHKEKILRKEDYIGKNSLLTPLIKKKGEPLHPNEIALAEIEKIAKKDGCEIAVCGEGADDIFGGYGQNFRMYINYKNTGDFFDFFLDNYRYFNLNDRKSIVNDEFLVDDVKVLNSFMPEKEIPPKLENKAFYFTQKIHTPCLITRGANAMRFNNVETGFPYTNTKLVDYVNSLPFVFKVKWKSKEHEKKSEGMHFRDISEKMDIPKYILKKIAERYLPNEIIYRPKHAFPVPFDKWFENLDEWDLNQEIFKTNNISRFNGWKKFMLINLNAFVEVFLEYEK